ncbi:MAG: diguanylate cyclase [Magnetococcus sp. YQC-5]
MFYTGEHYQDLVIFKGTPYESVRHILEQCSIRLLMPDEILIYPRKEDHPFYHLLEGQLTVHFNNQRTLPIATIRAGECVGELSVIDEESATAFVKASSHCRILEIEKKDLWSLISVDVTIAQNLLHIFAHRMRANTVALIDSQLMQTVPDIIYRLDQNGYFIFLNDAIEKLGYDVDELLGQHFERLILEADLDKVSYARVVDRIRSGQDLPERPPGLFDERRALDRKTTGLEVRLKRKVRPDQEDNRDDANGEIIADVSCTGIREALLRTECDPYVGTIGIIRDITERKRLMDQVAEQKARMEAIFNTAVDAIIVINDKGVIESMNQAAYKMFDYSEAQMLGHNISMVMDEPHRQLHDTYLARYLATGTSAILGLNREAVGVRRDGSRFPLEISVSEVNLRGRVLFTGIVRDITERKEAERIIHFQANYDALTRLPNRALFRRTLEQKLVEARKLGITLALIFIDLDRFKWINDHLGHPAGDALLQEAAHRLQKIVGEEGMVARMGGDEFTTMLTKNQEHHTLAQIARAILEQLNLPFQLEGQEVFISGSLGIARFPADAQETETLLKRADEAMYQSKNAGKNAYHFVTGEHLILEKKYTPSPSR